MSKNHLHLLFHVRLPWLSRVPGWCCEKQAVSLQAAAVAFFVQEEGTEADQKPFQQLLFFHPFLFQMKSSVFNLTWTDELKAKTYFPFLRYPPISTQWNEIVIQCWFQVQVFT